MNQSHVKTLLLLGSTSTKCSLSLLFNFARFWAQQGRRVFFVSQSDINSMPMIVGNVGEPFHPHVLKLIQIMYLRTWQDLLRQLYSIHLRRHLVSVLIIHNLEFYLKSETPEEDRDHASMICASLLNAASVCGKLTSQVPILLAECEGPIVEKTVLKNFFHNVWKIQTDTSEEKNIVEMYKLSPSGHGEVVAYNFTENADGNQLEFGDTIKKIIEIDRQEP